MGDWRARTLPISVMCADVANFVIHGVWAGHIHLESEALDFTRVSLQSGAHTYLEASDSSLADQRARTERSVLTKAMGSSSMR